MSSSWKTIATGLLLLYMATVALAGWPGQVRPSLLDAAHAASVRAVRLLGMSAGQPLFRTDENPWKQHGFCLFLRRDGGELLFPPGGECRIEGFHWRLPPVRRATHRLLSAAYRDAEGGRADSSLAYPRAIGRAFCLEPDEPPESIQAVWLWYYKHYDDGTVLRQNGLTFAYSCDQAELTELTWRPDDDSVLAFWGASPWR